MCPEIGFEALSTSFIPDDGQGKEDQPRTNSTRNQKGSSMHKSQTTKTPVKRPIISHISAEKRLNPQNLQVCTNLTNFHLVFFWLGEGGGGGEWYLLIHLYSMKWIWIFKCPARTQSKRPSKSRSRNCWWKTQTVRQWQPKQNFWKYCEVLIKHSPKIEFYEKSK